MECLHLLQPTWHLKMHTMCFCKVWKNIIFQNKLLLVMFYRHNKTFWNQFCNFKQKKVKTVWPVRVQSSLLVCHDPVWDWVTVGTKSKSHSSLNAYSVWCIALVPYALPCDWSQLHSTCRPSNQRCCRVVRLCVITKICEWISPAFSAQAYDALKEWWLLPRILDILTLQDKTLLCAFVDNFKQNGVFWRRCACVDNFKQNGVFWRQHLRTVRVWTWPKYNKHHHDLKNHLCRFIDMYIGKIFWPTAPCQGCPEKEIWGQG